MDGPGPLGDHGGPEQRPAPEVQRPGQLPLAPDPHGLGGVRLTGEVDAPEERGPAARLLDPPHPGDALGVLGEAQPEGVVLPGRPVEAGAEHLPVHVPHQPLVDQHVELAGPRCPCLSRPDVTLVAG